MQQQRRQRGLLGAMTSRLCQHEESWRVAVLLRPARRLAAAIFNRKQRRQFDAVAELAGCTIRWMFCRLAVAGNHF
jgi:hypothetical protein